MTILTATAAPRPVTFMSVLALVLFAGASVLFAESQKGPDLGSVVRDLYQAREKQEPLFYQTKDRTLLDRFFTKSLADKLWNDAKEAKGEPGSLDFDPLLGTREEITKFKVGETNHGKHHKSGDFIPYEGFAIVDVTFTAAGKPMFVTYQVQTDGGDSGKISNIVYNDGSSLVDALNPASYSDASLSEGAAGSCDAWAYVTDKDRNGLNVRATADSSSKIVGKIPFNADEGAIVHMTAPSGRYGWVKIDSAKTVAEKTTFKGSGAVSGNMLAVSTRGYDTEGVKLYATHEDGARVVTTVPPDMEVKIIACMGTKVQVKYKDKLGWLDEDSRCANPVTRCN